VAALKEPASKVVAVIVPSAEARGQPGEISVTSSASVQSTGVAAGSTTMPRGRSTVMSRGCPALITGPFGASVGKPMLAVSW
jgi:hypothetical protein